MKAERKDGPMGVNRLQYPWIPVKTLLMLVFVFTAYEAAEGTL